MFKIEIKQDRNELGGKTDNKSFNLEIDDTTMDVLVKCSPVLEKALIELVSKITDEEARHNKVVEQLDRDRFEFDKAQAEKDNFWKGRFEDNEKTIDTLRAQNDEYWKEIDRYQNMLMTNNINIKTGKPYGEE